MRYVVLFHILKRVEVLEIDFDNLKIMLINDVILSEYIWCILSDHVGGMGRVQREIPRLREMQ